MNCQIFLMLITGHSDVVMGAIATNREDLYEQLKYLQNGEGFQFFKFLNSITMTLILVY
jgi:cystathionine beta-lyase/cystathionine gamma-synthase